MQAAAAARVVVVVVAPSPQPKKAGLVSELFAFSRPPLLNRATADRRYPHESIEIELKCVKKTISEPESKEILSELIADDSKT